MKEQTSSSPWVKNDRPKDGSLWEDDSAMRIPGLGQTTATALIGYGINTVAEMIEMTVQLSESPIHGIRAKIKNCSLLREVCVHL